MKEPLGRTEALKRIQRIIKTGNVVISSHAKRELAADGMTTVDAMNVLRCGHIREEAEFENGSYRYRVHTVKMTVVVAFRSANELLLVTAWRKR